MQREKLENLKIKSDEIVNKYQNYLAMKSSNLKEEKIVQTILLSNRKRFNYNKKRKKQG